MQDGELFNTEWFDVENNWSLHHHSVIDLTTGKYYQGAGWLEVKEDHL